jgi:hypothetical protein
MADSETLSERVSTVERAMTDGETELPDASAVADVETRLDDIEAHLDDLDDRVTELEAATQALRGYVGSIRAVNEDVERRADAAIATVERLESRLDDDTAPARSDSDGARDSSPVDRGTGYPQQSSTGDEEHRGGDNPTAKADDQTSVPLDAPFGGTGTTDEPEFETGTGSAATGIEQPSTVGGDGAGQRGAGSGRSEERPPGVLARIRSLL